MPFLHAFDRFPDEAALIGKILAGYADLELSLLHCVHNVRDDFDGVMKAMYRARGEANRIRIADGLGRSKYDALGMIAEYEAAIAAMKHCTSIRNQYAHCAWHDDNTGQLAFVNIEELAQENAVVADLTGLTMRHVNVELLTRQLAYFRYTENLLVWANFEGRTRAGKPSIPTRQVPGYLPLPEKYLTE